VIAAAVTILSMVIVFPAAAFLSARTGRLSAALQGIFAATLWISILVKVYAWQVLLANRGPINGLLIHAGLAERPVELLYSRGAVIVAMTQFMVPYACILLGAGMRRMDWELVRVAR